MSRSFVIVTPAFNEEENIGATIESVARQSERPARWVIVSDGSTDRTDEIAAGYARQHDFLTFVRRERTGQKGFTKVHAYNVGLAQLAGVEHQFIGTLDADIVLPSNYFHALLDHFEAAPELGIGGGVVVEEHEHGTKPRRASPNSVAGAVQMFRRQCFDDIGGLLPLPLACEDAAAEITARARGWKVTTFNDLEVRHGGPTLEGGRSLMRARFRRGMMNYTLGYHPLFHLFVSLYRAADRPYGLSGLLVLAGYIWAALRRMEKPLPPEVMAHLRREQLQRLRDLVRLRRGAGSAASPS